MEEAMTGAGITVILAAQWFVRVQSYPTNGGEVQSRESRMRTFEDTHDPSRKPMANAPARCQPPTMARDFETPLPSIDPHDPISHHGSFQLAGEREKPRGTGR